MPTPVAAHRPKRITAIVPYFGYARSDRRDSRRGPIAASLVAELMQAAGIGHVTLVDVHAAQIEGFFRVPVDHLTAIPSLCDVLRGRLPADTVVVSPDAGRVQSATEYAQRLGLPLAVMHKRRGSGHETTVTHVVGDVGDRPCLIIDDMISTGGTIVESANALREAGSRSEFIVSATHGVFVDGACTRMADAGVKRVIVTDSVTEPERRCPNAEVVSIAPLLAGKHPTPLLQSAYRLTNVAGTCVAAASPLARAMTNASTFIPQEEARRCREIRTTNSEKRTRIKVRVTALAKERRRSRIDRIASDRSRQVVTVFVRRRAWGDHSRSRRRTARAPVHSR